MPIHIRIDGDVAILTEFGQAMNDPRYTDAAREVADLIDQGYRQYIVELRGVAETGPPLLGVLMTLTRQIRRRGGEVVLANLSGGMEKFLEEMQMEEYWDLFRNIPEALKTLAPRTDDSGSSS